MNTILLPDGFNGDLVECDCDPIEVNGDNYKLQVHDSYMIRNCTKAQWEAAMWEAYTKEETAAYYNSEYRSILEEEHKRKLWLEENEE